MRYTDVRPTIKSGDVLVWSYKGWDSTMGVAMELVTLFTRSKFNHVGVAVVIGGRVMVLEATFQGVKLNPLSENLPCYHISMPDYWNEHIQTFAFSTVGNKYSIWQAIKGWLGILKSGEDNQWQCAELVATILTTFGIEQEMTPTPTAIVQQLMEEGLTLRYLEKQ